MSPQEQLHKLASGKYISVVKAAKFTPYTAEYLSLLARKGKLKAIKINRDWITTPDAVSEYLYRQAKKHEKLSDYFKGLSKQQEGFARLSILIMLGVAVIGISNFLFFQVQIYERSKTHQAGNTLGQQNTTITQTQVLPRSQDITTTAKYPIQPRGPEPENEMSFISQSQPVLDQAATGGGSPSGDIPNGQGDITPKIDCFSCRRIDNNTDQQPQVLGVNTAIRPPAKVPAITTDYINSLITKQLDNYTQFLASFGLGKNTALNQTPLNNSGPTNNPSVLPTGPTGLVQNNNGQSTAVIGGMPIVSYYPAMPAANNFAGTTMAGFGNLSSNTFNSTTLNVAGAANAGSLTVNGNGSFTGSLTAAASTFSSLTVSGPVTFSGSTTIAGLIVNPGLTPGSISYQGTNSLSQDNANFFYDATNHRLGVGTASPGEKLEVVGDIISKGTSWTIRPSAGDSSWWRSVTYGNGLFVAVGDSPGTNAMTSPDGINWTIHTVPSPGGWFSVTYGNGLFVAVGYNHGIMTSPDGINWTDRSAPVTNSWSSVIYGNGLFVVLGNSNGINNVALTSPDGINWTNHTGAADLDWRSVTYGNGLFVAVAQSGTGNRVMTSPDGINWTSRTSAADNNWFSVTYGNGLFVATAESGTGNRVMTSPDGITWTIRTSAADNPWRSVTYGNGMFVAVAYSTGTRVMTSGKPELNAPVANNTYQGGMNIFGNVGIGTSSPGHLITLSGGAYSDGATWANASDRNLKENFATITPIDILQKIDGLLIQQWNYKSDPASTSHIGPTAQDFYAAFHTGGDSGQTSISTIDPSGVALLGIQALDQKLSNLQLTINNLQGSTTGNATATNLSVYNPSNFSGDSVGEAKILTGQTSVRITFSQPYQYQPIITVTSEDQSVSGAFVTDRDASGFTIRVPLPVTSPQLFAWHSFASPAERLTVSDGNTVPIQLILPAVVAVPPQTSAVNAIQTPLPDSTSTPTTNPDASSTPEVLSSFTSNQSPQSNSGLGEASTTPIAGPPAPTPTPTPGPEFPTPPPVPDPGQ